MLFNMYSVSNMDAFLSVYFFFGGVGVGGKVGRGGRIIFIIVHVIKHLFVYIVLKSSLERICYNARKITLRLYLE